MDLNALREMAIEAASRALYEKDGFVPSEESDEWEEEYRRQFAALKQQGWTIGAGYGALKDSTIRIGHMGDHTVAALEELLPLIGQALE